MKILILTNSLSPHSGWGRCAADLVYGLRNTGHDVVVLKEMDDGCEGIPILRRGLSLFLAAIRVRAYAVKCDVIHAIDGYPFGIIGALAAVGLQKKLFITAIGTYSVAPLYQKKTSLLLRWAFRRAAHVSFISRYTKAEVEIRMRLKSSSVVTLGIDSTKFLREHRVSPDPYVLSVGAPKYRKGYHVSIPAFGMLRKNWPSLKYKIVGNTRDAGHMRELNSLIEKLGLRNQVEFLGDVSEHDLGELYSHASLFVLPSVNQNHHFEGYGLVCVEAAAAGVPVIGTKGNGIEDAVRDGYNGILVSQNSIAELADAMSKLLGNQEVWLSMSTHGQEWAKSNDRSLLISRYLEIYNSL